LENPTAKPLLEQDPLEEIMHGSPFMSSEPVPYEIAKSATSEEYNSEDTLHLCEDERSSSLSVKFDHLPVGPKYVILDHDRDTTMISHNESLEMENQQAMELYEVLTLEFEEKDSTNEHGSFTLEIPQELCSFNTTPELGTLSAPCTHEDYNHLKVLSCKIFRRLVVDVYIYRKHCRFCGCTVALTL
jgi:hypothetical protein